MLRSAGELDQAVVPRRARDGRNGRVQSGLLAVHLDHEHGAGAVRQRRF